MKWYGLLITEEELYSLELLQRLAELPDGAVQGKTHRKWCARKQKQEKRASVCVRLKANPNRPTIPLILLANVCSLENKLDYCNYIHSKKWDCESVFVFTETWLHNNISDIAIQLDGLTSSRLTGMWKALVRPEVEDCVCILTIFTICKNTEIVTTHYSQLVEFLIVKCRSFYQPREFTWHW